MKRIVICCDGTWNTAKQGQPETNVVTLACHIKPVKEFKGIKPAADGRMENAPGQSVTGPDELKNVSMPHVKEGMVVDSQPREAEGLQSGANVPGREIEQIVYYHPGVGTSGCYAKRLWEGMTGIGVSANIRDAYRFVVEKYEPGDQLFLFGFSRGAFAARSLAGMIRKCGVLRREMIGAIGQAFNFYRARGPSTHPNRPAAKAFRIAYAVEEVTPIEFVGVWDTVGALGIPLYFSFINPWNKFHDVDLSTSIRNAYHAVAIDEKRRHFKPTLWHQRTPDQEMLAQIAQASQRPWSQTLEQVWFCGVHSNVGGGYNDADLSHIALLWMIRNAQYCGLQIDYETTQANFLGKLEESWNGIYRFVFRYYRPIADARHAGKTCESVHRTAAERWKEVAAYRPRNLKSYYDRHAEQLE